MIEINNVFLVVVETLPVDVFSLPGAIDFVKIVADVWVMEGAAVGRHVEQLNGSVAPDSALEMVAENGIPDVAVWTLDEASNVPETAGSALEVVSDDCVLEVAVGRLVEASTGPGTTGGTVEDVSENGITKVVVGKLVEASCGPVAPESIHKGFSIDSVTVSQTLLLGDVKKWPMPLRHPKVH